MKRRPPVVAKGAGVGPRRPRRRVIQSVLVTIGCVILGDALIGERGLVAMRRARQENESRVAALAAARAEHERLTEMVRLLKNDSSTIEDIARRDLGLIKPGEKVFTIRDVPPASNGR